MAATGPDGVTGGETAGRAAHPPALSGPVTSAVSTSLVELLGQFSRSSTVALIHRGATMTYADLDRQSSAAASALKRQLSGAGSGHQVAIATLLPPGFERIITMVAILKLHAVQVPLDTDLPPARMRSMLRRTQTAYVVTNEDSRSLAQKLEPDVKVILYDDLSRPDDVNTDAGCAAHDMPDTDPRVCALFTSGSGGEPKVVFVRSGNLHHRLAWGWSALLPAGRLVGCHKTSPLFVDSLTEVWGCLLRGAPLLLLDGCDVRRPEVLLERLALHDVTTITVVPTLLRAIIVAVEQNSHLADALKLRLVISSGETLHVEDAVRYFRAFGERAPLLANLYGSTEVTGDVTYEVFGDASEVAASTHDGHLSIGRPIANTDVYILDAQLAPLASGRAGDIYVSGPNVVLDGNDALHRISVAARGATHATVFATSDRGVVVGGRLYFLSRGDSRLKLGGRLLDLAEIERLVASLDVVDAVAVLACRQTDGVTRPVAFYSVARGDVATEDARAAVLAVCRRHLPPHAVPALCPLSALPLQPHTGKVDRQRLVTSHEATAAGGGGHSCDVIATLRDVLWGSCARVVHADENFFSAGGDSLACLTAISRLHDAGYDISVDDFLQAATIGAIADTVRDTGVSTSVDTGVNTGVKKGVDKAVDKGVDKDVDKGVNKSVDKAVDKVVNNNKVVNKVVNNNNNASVFSELRVRALDNAVSEAAVARLVARAFATRNPLDLLAGSSETAIERLVRSVWRRLLADGLSVVVCHPQSGAPLAVALVVDCGTPLVADTAGLRAVMAVNEAVEAPVLAALRDRRRWADSLLTAVDTALAADVSVRLQQLLSTAVLTTCERRAYRGVVTVNSHPATAVSHNAHAASEVSHNSHPATEVSHNSHPATEVSHNSHPATEVSHNSHPATEVSHTPSQR